MNQTIDYKGTKFDGDKFGPVFETRELGAQRKLLARGLDEENKAQSHSDAAAIDPLNGSESQFLSHLETLLGDFHGKVKWKEGGSELEKYALELQDRLRRRIDLNKMKDRTRRDNELRVAIANA